MALATTIAMKMLNTRELVQQIATSRQKRDYCNNDVLTSYGYMRVIVAVDRFVVVACSVLPSQSVWL